MQAYFRSLHACTSHFKEFSPDIEIRYSKFPGSRFPNTLRKVFTTLDLSRGS